MCSEWALTRAWQETGKSVTEAGAQDLAHGVWGHRSRALTLTSPCSAPWGRSHDPRGEGLLPRTSGRGASLPERHREDSSMHAASWATQSLRPDDASPRTPMLHQTGLRTLTSDCFFRSPFPYEGPQVVSDSTLISILFSCWCRHFNFQIQPRTLTGYGENFFPPHTIYHAQIHANTF